RHTRFSRDWSSDVCSSDLIVAFNTYVGQFWEPISRLGQFYTQLLVAMASSERIFEFLDARPDVADAPGARNMPPIQGRVRFEHRSEERRVGKECRGAGCAR